MALKMVYSLLTERDKIFVPLPEDQQITEQSLIELEREIAKSVRKNESMLTLSEELAARSSLG